MLLLNKLVPVVEMILIILIYIGVENQSRFKCSKYGW